MTFWDKLLMQLREICLGMISNNLTTIFSDVNSNVSGISADLAQTPDAWNSGLWSMATGVAENVIMPIAGIILTYVMCMELISIASDKNNMHSPSDVVQMLLKQIIKMFIAVLLVQKGAEITLGLFQMGSWATTQAGGYVAGEGTINIDVSVTALIQGLRDEPISAAALGNCSLLVIMTWVISFALKIIQVIIQVIMIGRMIEIYMYCSIGPLPFSTLMNREWGAIGQNYIKTLAALAFQGLMMFISVAIYNVLIVGVTITDDLQASLWQVIVYSVVLAYSLFKTSTLTKSIFGAH